QEEGTDKEVKIVQITKQRAQDKQDLQGLNIALNSKQELELVRARRMGVCGTGGATPAQPSKVAARRDLAVFSTAEVTSRPPSGLSDVGTDGGSASRTKMATLGKSTRLNGSAAKPSAASPACPWLPRRPPRPEAPSSDILRCRRALEAPWAGAGATKHQWKESDAGEVRVHSV
ncbi:hypothetical protein B0H11DRAFT_1707599, partial [Mycena galericulata]